MTRPETWSARLKKLAWKFAQSSFVMTLFVEFTPFTTSPPFGRADLLGIMGKTWKQFAVNIVPF